MDSGGDPKRSREVDSLEAAIPGILAGSSAIESLAVGISQVFRLLESAFRIPGVPESEITPISIRRGHNVRFNRRYGVPRMQTCQNRVHPTGSWTARFMSEQASKEGRKLFCIHGAYSARLSA